MTQVEIGSRVPSRENNLPTKPLGCARLANSKADMSSNPLGPKAENSTKSPLAMPGWIPRPCTVQSPMIWPWFDKGDPTADEGAEGAEAVDRPDEGK